LHDVWEAAQAISRFTEGKDLAAYTQEEMIRAAVERKFGIIGEALSRLEKEDPQTAQAIPELRRIVGLRNRLIHGYDHVDDSIIWDIVQHKLPSLAAQISALLSDG